MPAKGKHRRPKSLSISRGLAVAGTGGAALALPLLGAAGAQAAGAPATAPVVAPAAAPAAPATQVPAALQAASPTVYTVVPGDYLSKIAAERHLSGGWERLYADNREAVGSNPSLIHPGLKLTLGAKGDSAPAAESAPAGAPAPAEASSGEQDAPAPAPQPKKQAPKAKSGGSSAGTTGTTGSTEAKAAPSAAGFVAPVSGGVSTPYRASGAMWSSGYHTGVDFIAKSGTTVKAVGAGTVVSAGWGGSYGNEVVIQHEDGKYSQYAHLSSLAVSVGQSVTGGQSLGLSGSTGNSTGPHLHFEIRTGSSYGSDVDPLAYLRSKGVTV